MHNPISYLYRIAALALTVAVLGGCTTSKITTLGSMDNIDIVKESTDEKGEYLIVRLDLTNTSKTAQELDYRIRWLDKEGDPVWNEEPWKPLLLLGKQTIHIESVAPTRQAVDYAVEMHAVNN